MRTLGLALALLAALPALARAAAPGMNLSWGTCGLTAITGNLNFTCGDNTVTRALILSYRLPANTPDFVAVSVVFDYGIGDPGTPPWFQFGPGGCREGSFSPIGVGTITGCTNPYAGAIQTGGFEIEPLAPNRYRVRADWARSTPAAQTANTLYTAMAFLLDAAKSFDDGSGYCQGCEVPACFVLLSLQVFTASTPGIHADITTSDVRNWASYQGGGFCGCPCLPVPARNSTWGMVKALYR